MLLSDGVTNRLLERRLYLGSFGSLASALINGQGQGQGQGQGYEDMRKYKYKGSAWGGKVTPYSAGMDG